MRATSLLSKLILLLAALVLAVPFASDRNAQASEQGILVTVLMVLLAVTMAMSLLGLVRKHLPLAFEIVLCSSFIVVLVVRLLSIPVAQSLTNRELISLAGPYRMILTLLLLCSLLIASAVVVIVDAGRQLRCRPKSDQVEL